jgi:hypothetical protein
MKSYVGSVILNDVKNLSGVCGRAERPFQGDKAAWSVMLHREPFGWGSRAKHLSPPQGAGLGVALDWAVVKEWRVEE